jgi:hypothetical protein
MHCSGRSVDGGSQTVRDRVHCTTRARPTTAVSLIFCRAQKIELRRFIASDQSKTR